MRSLSLQARLLIGVAVVVVVLLAVAALVTTTTRDYLVGQVDDQLLEASEFGRDIPLPPGGSLRLPPPDVDEADDDGDEGDNREPERLSPMFQGLLTVDGELVTIFAPNLPGRTYSPPELEDTQVLDRPFTVSADNDDYNYRVVATEDRFGDGLRIQAMALSDIDDVVERMITYQALGLMAVLILLAAVAWWVNRLGVRPINMMTAAAAEIADGDLSVRIPSDSMPDTEAGRLARALNTMMGRIQEAMATQERSEQRLRRFLADASHELRTPITTVRGYAELYHQGGLGDKIELDDAMRRTEQEATRLERLVADMMTLTRLDQSADLEMESVDLSAIVVDAAKDASAVAPDRSIAVAVDDGLRVTGDEDRLRQVLANVVANALTHTPADSPLTITASRATVDTGMVVVEVADGGPGMKPDVVDQVTGRFFRADPSRSRDSGGSGLGLAIVQAIVDAHHGDLAITSAVASGTTVRVGLPLADDSS